MLTIKKKKKKFWVDKLGFTIKLEKNMGPIKWLEVSPTADASTNFVLYDKKAMLTQNPNANVSHPSIILSTDNIESKYEEMKSSGIEVGPLNVMPYGKMFSFKDMDNNTFLLRED